jgi:hypothetical protein
MKNINLDGFPKQLTNGRLSALTSAFDGVLNRFMLL